MTPSQGETGSQCLGTGMTRREHWNDRRRGATTVIKEPVSATRMIPSFYLVWVMQEVYSRYLSIDSANK
ncbi:MULTISPECIES: hypothetical protein [unclassified Wolbachia]|nr:MULTISPECIES: hypothetical protein [unclassified Wolbachia]